MNTHEIVTLMGGREKAAAACGITPPAVSKWHELGHIPSKHWPVAVAATDGSVSYEQLALLKEFGNSEAVA